MSLFLTSNIKTIRVDDYTGYNFYHSYISDHRPLIWSFEVESIDLYSGLIINEIMQNPASISDAVGEWIEITNISLDTINLNGLIISDNDGEQHIISDENLTIVYNSLHGITIVLLFCSLVLAIHSISSHRSINQGIIYNSSVDVRSEPNQFSTRLFKVHEGLKVSVKQIIEGWLEIELLDGKIGWISENQIRLLN